MMKIGIRLDLAKITEQVRERLETFSAILRNHGYDVPLELSLELGSEPIEQAVRYILQQNGTSEVGLEDAAIGFSYAVLGAPGQGKTHLMMVLLEEILQGSGDAKHGVVIIDPKGALRDEVWEVAGVKRQSDIVIVSGSSGGTGVNLLAGGLDSIDAGRALLLSAQAVGLQTGDQYWLNVMANALGAIHFVKTSQLGRDPTLEEVLRDFVSQKTEVLREVREVEFEKAENAVRRRGNVDMDDWKAKRALFEVSLEEATEDDRTVRVVRNLVRRAYLPVLQPDAIRAYSNSAASGSLYDQVMDEGKILLVSPSPKERGLRLIVCALAKAMAQLSVLTRFDRSVNRDRAVFFMIDEFADVASQVGSDFGDITFVQNSRQFRGGGFYAIQGLSLLGRSGIGTGDSGAGMARGLPFLDCLNGFFTFRLNSPADASHLQAVAGKQRVIDRSVSATAALSGGSQGVNQTFGERDRIPAGLLTSGLMRGQCCFIGSLDGRTADVHYMMIRERRKENGESGRAPVPGTASPVRGEPVGEW